MIPRDRALTLRHELHLHPELSGQEQETAQRMAKRLRELGASVQEQLGGWGVLGVFDSQQPGPSILLRAELDALPIPETIRLPHGSKQPGVAHKCGHDGHMAILDGVAARLAEQSIARGRVGLLFQPAEESGAGAAAVLADPAWQFEFDAAYALHNLPGVRAGDVLCRAGTAALASRGLEVSWQGREAHAAHPDEGLSPMQAWMATTLAWSERATHPARFEHERMTVVHAGVGHESAFGTAPGLARLQATLRAGIEAELDQLQQELESLVVQQEGLRVQSRVCDPFPECRNHPEAVARVGRAARAAGLEFIEPAAPFPWSEDFGHFLRLAPGALIGLGAGLEQPPLHDPAYDFPDAILPLGIEVFAQLIDSHLRTDAHAKA